MGRWRPRPVAPAVAALLHRRAGLIFVVDSTDEARFSLAAEELRTALADDQLRECVVLVLANKQDVATARPVAAVQDALGLGEGGPTAALLGSRRFRIMPASATKDTGINEAIAWLSSAMKPL